MISFIGLLLVTSIHVFTTSAFGVDQKLQSNVHTLFYRHHRKKQFNLDRSSDIDTLRTLYMKKVRNHLELTNSASSWVYLSEIVRIKSRWITIVAERFRDDNHNDIDYWRIERPSSAIIIVIQDDKLVFPKAQYRPGIGHHTLDFCGGRIPDGMENNPIHAVPGILLKELDFIVNDEGIGKNIIGEINCLNADGVGWEVDSSVSSQKLFGFVVTIDTSVSLNESKLHEKKVDINNYIDLDHLMKEELTCLQCRSVLMEWILQQRTT